jgi:hypothetical protein
VKPNRLLSEVATSASIDSASFTLFGHTVTVRYSRDDHPWPARLNDLLETYRALPAPGSGADAATVITVQRAGQNLWSIEQHGDVETYEGEDILVSVLEGQIIVASVQYSSLPLLLHAGAVVRNNSAIILPAVSGSGKTTLTLALRARGWLPLTDDICSVGDYQAELTALPCRRCCHLSPDSLAILADRGIPLQGPVANLSEYYRPPSWGVGAPIRWVIASQYQADAPCSLQPLTQAEAAAVLIESSFFRPGRTQRSNWPLAIRLACQAPAFRLTYSALDDAFEVIERVTRGKT